MNIPESQSAIKAYTTIEDAPTRRMIGLQSYSIFNGREHITGRKTGYSLIIYFGGPTGAGKTVLEILYAKEEKISYDIDRLAKEAGVNLNLNQLRESLKLVKNLPIHVLSVPKLTTRDPRTTESHGIDFYFLPLERFDDLRGKLLFTYQYPDHEGALYGMPKSIKWPLKFGVDSLVTMTGYNSFSKMAQVLPNAVGILVDADSRDIEAHIKGRAASAAERESRLRLFPKDKQEFYEHRHDIPYSVFIDSLKALRTEITPDRERLLYQEMDIPLRQIGAIVRWERYLREQSVVLSGGPQQKFDYFLDHVVRRLFDTEYGELRDKLSNFVPVPIIDTTNEKDDMLLADYVKDRGLSRVLLESITKNVQVNAVIDANGRRTIVLSPPALDYIPGFGTGKKAVIELLARRLNGVGAHLIHEQIRYRNDSLLSLLSSPFYHLDEGLFVTLSADHVPVKELERPRALNILFSDAPNPKEAKSSISPLSLDEVVDARIELASDDADRNIFRRSTQL